MSETALPYAPLPDVGAAVAQAKASGKEFVRLDQELVRLAQDTVEKSIIMGQLLRKSWETFFAESDSETAERPRALRGYFLQQLGQSLGPMRFALYQAARAAPPGGEPLRGVDLLAEETAALESIQREALSLWGVSEDVPSRLAALADFPLQLDQHGDVHVGKSRVLLNTIVEHHKAGMSPEEIARGYDTLQPADVYDAIAYYLRHKEDVEAYLQRRDLEAEALWQQIEASQPSNADLKAQIKERWSRRNAGHAAPVK